MTDLKQEDVMRALECCALGDCYPCPYWNNIGAGCRDKMAENALALLREKDKEIEKLKTESELVAKHSINHTHPEVIYAEDIVIHTRSFGDYDRFVETIRVETLIDFAERLKSHEFYEVADKYAGMQYGDFCDWVDQIAKELGAECDDEPV